MAEKALTTVVQPVIVRPGEEKTSTKIGQYSPEMVRLDSIKMLMAGRATLSRISREQIILESLVDAAEKLGYKLTATRTLVTSSRELSPGVDGLGRGEAVKCLVPPQASGVMYPTSAFSQEDRPGILQRLIAFLKGSKSEGSG